MTDIVELTTTVESAEQAQAIANQMVNEQLAACVQITGPIQSVYRWKGQLCSSTEYRCTMKTTRQLLEALMERVKVNHPYEVPEILAVQVTGCGAEYEEWLRAQLGS